MSTTEATKEAATKLPIATRTTTVVPSNTSDDYYPDISDDNSPSAAEAQDNSESTLTPLEMGIQLYIVL